MNFLRLSTHCQQKSSESLSKKEAFKVAVFCLIFGTTSQPCNVRSEAVGKNIFTLKSAELQERWYQDYLHRVDQEIEGNDSFLYKYQKAFVKEVLQLSYEAKRAIHMESQRKDADPRLALVFDIPESLLLAQAIQESGWGQSDTARIKRNIYGIVNTEGVPFIFPNYRVCMDRYLRTLLQHYAYEDFRELLHQKDLSVIELVEQLGMYNEDPESYFSKLTSTIKAHHLERYDAIDTMPSTSLPYYIFGKPQSLLD